MSNPDSSELTGLRQGKVYVAGLIKATVGYEGGIKYNSEYPDGTMRKLLDVSAVSNLGWNARIGLHEGVAATYQWYLDHQP